MKKTYDSKKEETTISREELEMYKNWYIPSKVEKSLLDRILYELSQILKEKGINSSVKWCNFKKAIITIPYGETSKIECSGEKPFSIEVKAVQQEKDIYISFIINKKEHVCILKGFSIKHGFINHDERIYTPPTVFMEAHFPAKSSRKKDSYTQKSTSQYSQQKRQINQDNGNFTDFLPFYDED